MTYPYPITRGPSSSHSAGLAGGGIDFATPTGVEVAAPDIGGGLWTVTRSEDRGRTSYGQWIELRSGNVRVRYAHLSKRLVDVGEQMVGGCLIGLTGNSGGSTGPHLHFEATENVYAYAKRIWEVVTVLTQQDKAWIDQKLDAQAADLINAICVGQVRKDGVPDGKRGETTIERAKKFNLRAQMR